jgi:exonuclease VII small subunit
MQRQDQEEPRQATTSAELEQQASELAKRLSALEAEECSLDSLADFERVVVIAGQKEAIAKALDRVNELIGEARKAEKQAAEVQATERKLAAIGAARSEERAIIGVLQHLDQSVMSSFDAALAELYATGACTTPEVATIERFRQHLVGTLEALGSIDPVLFGKAPAPSAKERQIAEARAEANLVAIARDPFGGSEQRNNGRGHWWRETS